MPLCDEDRTEVGRVASGRNPFHIFEQLLALYLRCSAFCAPLPISLSFLPSAVVEVGFRTSEFVQTPTGTVAARVWSQEVQELKSLDFHFLNCPNQLQQVFLDTPSPLSE